eukprot:1195282-Prorocentrum_minimum.AAC.7
MALKEPAGERGRMQRRIRRLANGTVPSRSSLEHNAKICRAIWLLTSRGQPSTRQKTLVRPGVQGPDYKMKYRAMVTVRGGDTNHQSPGGGPSASFR